MSRAALIAVASILVVVGSAEAAGINLYWNDCSVSGVTNKNFACSNNATNFDLYASIDPPAGVVAAIGHNHVIALQSASSRMPAWWDFYNAGACREFSLSASGDFTTSLSGGTDCIDPWQGFAIASVLAYEKDYYGDPRTVRLIASITTTPDHAAEMFPGYEHYSLKLRINSSKTVGTETCAGCIDPVCIVLNESVIIQSSGPTFYMCNPMLSNFTTWQGGNVGGPGCPPVDSQYGCATPAGSPTWGRVKSLYR